MKKITLEKFKELAAGNAQYDGALRQSADLKSGEQDYVCPGGEKVRCEVKFDGAGNILEQEYYLR